MVFWVSFLVSPIVELVKCLCSCMSNRADYNFDLQNNLSCLKSENERLCALERNTVLRVQGEETNHRQRTYRVRDWLERVTNVQQDMDHIIYEGEEEIRKKCLRCFCPKNFPQDEVGKKVSLKLKEVSELIREGNFDVVTERKPLDRVDELPVERTVGMESYFGKVWNKLEGQSVVNIGIYGMGGVGKTTLLKKINNKFLSVDHDFDAVIWVVVSKDANLEKVQEAIRKKLNVPEEEWRTKSVDEKSSVILRLLKGRKFVLLLDDLWHELDLVKIGIPPLDEMRGSIIVFTTRSEDICHRMGAEKRIKVDCLEEEKALHLFHMHVGEETLKAHQQIPLLARLAAKECQGLPLALITVGRAMACRRMPEEWEHAINLLRSYPSKFSGMEDHVFPILKFSYDSLKDESIKSCFLYCSIFPEDHEIRKQDLIELWIREGYLHRFDNVFDARKEGTYIVESLRLACLLESCVSDAVVKMHDVMRDMALWLARDQGENESKFVVAEHASLIGAQGFVKWKEAEKLSMWGNSFRKITEVPSFPNLRTLMIRATKLSTFPGKFFQYMQSLRILDLSNNGELIRLPEGIAGLINLQYLNLSHTRLESLPWGVKYLTQLKTLLLDETWLLSFIPRGVISKLASLQVFSKIDNEANNLSSMEELLKEFDSLEHIADLGITLTTRFSIQTLWQCSKLQRCIRQLSLNGCVDLISSDVSFASLKRMEKLETLKIRNCPLFEELEIDPEEEEEQTKQEIRLELVPIKNGHFHELRHLTIRDCSNIKHLTWSSCAPNLQSLSLIRCLSIVEIISGKANRTIFRNLSTLYLEDLPNLKNICKQVLPFPSLEMLILQKCPRLKKLPFGRYTAKNSLKAIRAEQAWWGELEWSNEDIMCAFASKFEAVQRNDSLFKFLVNGYTVLQWFDQADVPPRWVDVGTNLLQKVKLTKGRGKLSGNLLIQPRASLRCRRARLQVLLQLVDRLMNLCAVFLFPWHQSLLYFSFVSL